MKPLLLLLLLAALSFAQTGCITCQECGTLKRDHEITSLFLNNEIVPGYSYYFNGRSQWPTAVLAIDSSYTVRAEFWKPVDLAGPELSEWLQNATNWKGSRQTNKFGAEILNPAGERVGIFFSKYDKLITKFSSDNVIQVYPPSYNDGRRTGSDSSDRN